MCNIYRGPSIDASHQVSVHLAKGFQRRRLKCEKLTDDGRRTPSDGKSSHCLWQGEQNCLWWPCSLMDQDVISNLYWWPSIYDSYQVSVHLVKRFQRRRFCLEIDQSEKRIACGGHVWQRIRTKWALFIEDLPYMLPTKFQFIWQLGFRKEF